MGIKNFNELIRKICPDFFQVTSLTFFCGTKIAIDTNMLMYKYVAASRKEYLEKIDLATTKFDRQNVTRIWTNKILDFITKLLSYGITPIFVFDGLPLEEKQKVREERRSKKEKEKKEIQDLEQKIDNVDILEKSYYTQELSKKLKNHNDLKKEDYDLIKSIISCIGLPCIDAKNDGEKLCVMMVLDGKAQAAYTSDTDAYAYGCPFIINDIEGQNVKYCILSDFTEKASITNEQLTDLCIMCGCDYNTNIKGCGIIGSYNLIKEFGNIDNITKKDVTILNHLKCREIFKSCHYSACISKIYSTEVFDIDFECIKNCRDFMEIYGLERHIGNIDYIYSKLIQEKSRN